ncbi:leucine--tRNA ligase [Buchnera aphidicola (Muscaphis stroyani)]|uniref:Leucine--tRNA ligase n=1 Tax=Buchnera aphidicola (Muscaphis stroyani) TaxID=1241869 RepID=A0A4D6YFP5_9GAMM|nr:leucine--tRNA ligase [Buchnera aphidicola]QCI24490.1 leucine--tRNA ligase [Buchnera aphidicola (Muscaphis stroyani)]
MKKEYTPKEIEFYVQKHWDKNKTFQANEDSTKKKYYCLPMLPYPSGKLHMGHVRNYTISDVISRYQRMLGKNVLQPIGWDAFGLPAEEAAIQNNIVPDDWTYKNIKYMKNQLKSMGFSYDWNRELTTCKPEYYRWEQWFFIKLYKKKLVYKKNSLVNWCPYDKTVLANEQVVNGCCWRCHSQIKIKKIPQWFIKIRSYAESLHKDLEKLKNWPEKVKNMQKNWIGRLKGFDITLNLENSNKTITAFITQIETIMGATYIVISPCHKISIEISKKNKIIKKFIQEKSRKNTLIKETKEVKYEGTNSHLFALHPITTKKIPIWISNFIVEEYGVTSMISTPAHNQHDWNFATQNNLKIKYVIKNNNLKEIKQSPYLSIKKKEILCNSGIFNGFNLTDGKNKIKNFLIKKNVIKDKINYKLQDWCISRQRYWGAPIPMATLKNGKVVPVPENELPILLPQIKKSINTLYSTPYHSLSNKIYINNEPAIREKDTFDTFMESSWYYARYTCPDFHTAMIDPVRSKYWLPVDQYIGGIEHAIMHLMYFRFYHKLLRDFKLVDSDEPVKNLLCQGMVLSEAFYESEDHSKRNWIHSSSVSTIRDSKGRIIKSYNNEGKEIIYAGMIKMSKSKKNGIEPELMIHRYGADTVRLFIMFAAPVESSLEWQESGVKGIYRFLRKLWKLAYNYVQIKHTHTDINFINLNKQQKELRYLLHKTIDKVSDDIGRRTTFNTAISSIMELSKKLLKAPMKTQKDKSIMKEALCCIIKMLYPFTPHFCFLIWENLNNNSSIDYERWPVSHKEALFKEFNILIIQINGKTKCTIKIHKNLTKEEILLNAKSEPKIKKKIKDINIQKIIYIPKKIINFIT